jgi:hypothetical protein
LRFDVDLAAKPQQRPFPNLIGVVQLHERGPLGAEDPAGLALRRSRGERLLAPGRGQAFPRRLLFQLHGVVAVQAQPASERRHRRPLKRGGDEDQCGGEDEYSPSAPASMTITTGGSSTSGGTVASARRRVTSRRGSRKRASAAVSSSAPVAAAIPPRTNAGLHAKPSITACAASATTTIGTTISSTPGRTAQRAILTSRRGDERSAAA